MARLHGLGDWHSPGEEKAARTLAVGPPRRLGHRDRPGRAGRDGHRVLDEAHRLARDVPLDKIMNEGLEYGVALVVASQGVDDFNKDVLGNAGTKVAFRCNYRRSRTVAGSLRGRSGQDVAEALEQLSVGQAYASTREHATARNVFMARD